MSLNPSKGNMYDFVTHTWNTVKGACPHDCSYCYMKRWGTLRAVHFDQRELKADLGEGNFIFVGSSCDMFAETIPDHWIYKTLEKCEEHEGNKYLFQSKNPSGMNDYLPNCVIKDFIVCTTLESNRVYPEIMGKSPTPKDRAFWMNVLSEYAKTYVTIEPILDFDLEPMIELIKRCEPVQVNIGADSGRNGLPEPPRDKVLALIDELSRFTTIARKTNLGRLLAELPL